MKKNSLDEYLNDWNLKDPANKETISEVEKSIGFTLPNQYKEFLLHSNGIEVSIGQNSYLVIWPINDLIELNNAYEVAEFAPGLILFGSDGGDTAFAFDSRVEGLPIVEVPFIGMALEEIVKSGETLIEFLNNLSRKL